MSTWFSFFFQAEDGIRDVAVTGVQTCALPISVQYLSQPLLRLHDHRQVIEKTVHNIRAVSGGRLARDLRRLSYRSEERRVGKSVDLGGRRIIKKKKRRRR